MRAMVTHTERREAVELDEVSDSVYMPRVVDIIEDWIGESPNGFERRRRWFLDLMGAPGLAFNSEIREQVYMQRIVDERRMRRQGQVNLS